MKGHVNQFRSRSDVFDEILCTPSLKWYDMRVVRPLEGKQQPRFVFEVLIWILVRYESCMLWVESPEATLNLILENEKLKLLINISCSCIYIWLHLFICRMTVIKERQYCSHRGRLSKSKSVNYFFKFVICFICYSLYNIYMLF